MKVILEAQHACIAKPNGIPHYTMQLIKTLLHRKQNDYELVFFDFKKEMDNRQWIDKHFGEYNPTTHECNILDYRIARNVKDAYKNKSYNDFTGATGDVFHFMNMYAIPDNIKGNMVVTIHDMIPVIRPEWFKPWFYDMFCLNLERLSKMQPIIVADSLSAKKDTIHYAGIPEENIHIVPLAYDIPEFYGNEEDELVSLGVNKLFVLYLGDLGERKNIVRVIAAFESIAKRFPDINLVVAGNMVHDSGETLEKIKTSPFSSRIILTGYVSNSQRHALYSNALVFVYPSLHEGFGIPVLEAMVRGCPVITSNVSSLPEVAGDAAILVDPYDTEQLAHELERVISSESLREELKQKGLEQSKKFSWNKTAEMTEEVYKIFG